jgi:hypothetical protein
MLRPFRVSRAGSRRSRSGWHVRYASNSDPIGASQRSVAMCHSPTYAVQQIAMLFDYLVSDGQQAGALFAGFVATMTGSDFSYPCVFPLAPALRSTDSAAFAPADEGSPLRRPPCDV